MNGVEAVLRLQRQGFSLESLALLFDALASDRSLASVLGVTAAGSVAADPDHDADSADLYGFAELQPARSSPRRGGALGGPDDGVGREPGLVASGRHGPRAR